MELRLKTARTTRDIDLALKRLPSPKAGWEANAQRVLELLRESGRKDLGDYFSFVVGEAVQDWDAAPYGGARFPVESQMAGRLFVKFHLDVSSGDVLREPYELLHSRDWLSFAGIAAMDFPSISSEEQFAEKLHAYSLPRKGRENSRVKDLVDLVLLIERSPLDAVRLQMSIKETFQRRKTHELPEQLQVPPTSWSTPFSELATECGIDVKIETQFRYLEKYLRGISMHD